MTDFIRTIWQTAAAQKSGDAGVAVKTEVQPVDQIELPPVGADESHQAEKQRLVKVEAGVAAAAAADGGPDAGKAQRAARRDVVNARRDKRKTMSPAGDSGIETPGSPSPATAVPDDADGHDKLKKMKTGKTTSVVVSPTAVTSPTTVTSSPATSPRKSATIALGGMLGSLTAELDPSGEERLRAMEAQLEHLDPDSKEAKKKRRLIRNRMSAQLHRERKKAYVGQLEEQLQEKERELKLLQDKLTAMTVESSQLKEQLSAAATTTPSSPVSSTNAPVESDGPKVAAGVVDADVVIKKEPLFGEALDVDMEEGANTIDLTSALSDNWADCLDGLEDMADVATEDLLSGLDDYPFATAGGYAGVNSYPAPATATIPSVEAPHSHDMHAAKKNLAMMMAMMLSVTFCGNSPAGETLASGSAFSTMFGANPPKELSQMSIASRIVACLEKTSWEEFQDISSWTTAATTAIAGAAVAVRADNKEEDEEDEKSATEKTETEAEPERASAAASPSARSDVTDSSDLCHSPKPLSSFDPIDEFVYPVDDPLAAAAAAIDPAHSWFDDFGHSDVEDVDDVVVAAKSPSKSLTSRLYAKLSTLWHEKNQVLLTVVDEKNAVTKRSIADMSRIRKVMESGALFGASGDDAVAEAATDALLAKSDKQAVTFLYPLSALAGCDLDAMGMTAKPAPGSDEMFLEVSCQLHGAAAASLF